MLRTRRLAHLSVYVCVCLSVRKVYCGKTADWIRMPFGTVNGVGLCMGVLDFGGVTNATRSSQITSRTCCIYYRPFYRSR